MSNVLPYDENICMSDGGFITTDGKFIYTPMTHEAYAINFCLGKDFLSPKKNGDKRDTFSSSKLSDSNLALCKAWLNEKSKRDRNAYSDFLVYVLGYDKVETCLRRLITTTSPMPHIRFYNYYLMGWNVCKLNRKRFDEEKNIFIVDYADNLSPIFMSKDREAEAEIEEIKKKVLFNNRDLYFKTNF